MGNPSSIYFVFLGMIPRQHQVAAALEKHVPPAAFAYCLGLWQATPFVLRLKPKRQTKLGDYRYEPRQRWHIISVNRDLDPHPFLLTYVHEVAHLVTFNEYRGKVQPHGPEWKHHFRELMQPLLVEEVYPQPILGVLARHMVNPKASSHADPALVKVMYPELQSNAEGSLLQSLSVGDGFIFRNQPYRVLEHRRTRTLVTHQHTGRNYLISQQVLVSDISENKGKDTHMPLGHLKPGAHFRYQNEEFTLVKHRRSKSLIQLRGSKHQYLLVMKAVVEVID